MGRRLSRYRLLPEVLVQQLLQLLDLLRQLLELRLLSGWDRTDKAARSGPATLQGATCSLRPRKTPATKPPGVWRRLKPDDPAPLHGSLPVPVWGLAAHLPSRPLGPQPPPPAPHAPSRQGKELSVSF